MKMICSLVFAFLSQLQAQTAPEKFSAGVHAFRTQDYAAAKTHFLEALKIQPHSPSTLYNLALSEQKLGQKGWAVAHLRQALELNPHYRQAREAYQWLLDQVDRPIGMPQGDWWESLRETLLRPVSGQVYAAFSSVLLLLSGWLLLGFWAARVKARRQNQPYPPFPLMGTLSAMLLAGCVFLGLAKLLDAFTPRATLIADKTEVKSSPDAESATLAELNQGIEVILKSEKDNWAQVRYPGGITGWVSKEKIAASSGLATW